MPSAVHEDQEAVETYNFYKYYKACDLDCDLYITLLPYNGIKTVSVLMNYQNPLDINSKMTMLPTWQNKPTWTASLKYGSIITIEGAEPYFFEKHGKKANMHGTSAEIKPTSKGYYYIGVQSYEEVDYTISVTTKPHNASREDGKNSTDEQFLDIDTLYLGP